MAIIMDYKSVYVEYLKNNSTFNQDEIDLIYSYFNLENIKNEKPLVVEGKKYTKNVFVISGIFRVFVIDPKGDEVVKNFIEPKSFFADIRSLETN
jgi:CRP-like cAMP-binding protein